ncbi:MAG: DnaA regulatory inactivator Hda [Gammaproteobacteria bacterium]|nr:DnaA regulatory inactivator Hda [Gammaproteobacteria bacterium]
MAGLDTRQHQLALEVQLRDDATLENFLAAPAVQPLVLALQQQIAAQGEPIIYLYGPGGTGKSHLLQAACHLAGSGALYLPLAELVEYGPEDVLQGVETLELVCLDDVHAVLGKDDWELALFDLCNRARQWGCRLLVAADAAPRALAVALADLRSRLSWGIVYQLPQADDDAKDAILRFRAARRGLTLSAEVSAYIVSRAPRSLESLLALLDTLDKASLAEQRALSIPFVKQTLRW